MVKKTANQEKQTKKGKQSSKLPFTSINYLFFGISVISIALGFLILAQGSITLAPILLVLGYCVFMPLAILLRGDKKKKPIEVS
ncbi:hypothetical protein JW877_08215 [bacterium]|nr:hypothetical protein [bacterium]